MTDREDRRVVRVEPSGREIEVLPGETLIEAAWRQGLYWPTICYGQAQCMACHVVVQSGADNLSEVGEEEAEAMRLLLRVRGGRSVDRRRLACRLEVLGPAVVEKRGVRPRTA
jgi:2Fe-2S ferredoxin